MNVLSVAILSAAHALPTGFGIDTAQAGAIARLYHVSPTIVVWRTQRLGLDVAY